MAPLAPPSLKTVKLKKGEKRELGSTAAFLLFTLFASFTFSLANSFLPPLSIFPGLHAALQLLSPPPLSFIPPPLPGGGGSGGEKLVFPLRSPSRRVYDGARLLVKARRVPPHLPRPPHSRPPAAESSQVGRTQSRSPSRATSATLPHVSAINLPPGGNSSSCLAATSA